MTQADLNELEFLRFFHSAAGDAFGPADSDVYAAINDEWVSDGNVLPEGYGAH